MAITRAKTSSVAQGPSTKKTLLGGNDVILGGSYDAIGTVTIGSTPTASVTFSGIPNTYKHLQVRLIGRDNRSAQANNIYWQVGNGSVDSGANYSWHLLRGAGTSSLSTGSANANYMLMDETSASAGASTFGSNIVDILDYANTNKYKTFRTLGGWENNGAGEVDLWSGSWRNTAAIDTLYFYPNAGSFVQYTQFNLYGIK
jgi:hypothetical protein